MRYFFASDIHGSSFYTKKIIEKYKESNASKLILLGDLLYHGPRNDLPKDYCPKKVFALLNEFKDDIIAVRGNCDSEVDQMVLDFPMQSDYCIGIFNDIYFFITRTYLWRRTYAESCKRKCIHIWSCASSDSKKSRRYLYTESGLSITAKGTKS